MTQNYCHCAISILMILHPMLMMMPIEFEEGGAVRHFVKHSSWTRLLSPNGHWNFQRKEKTVPTTP